MRGVETKQDGLGWTSYNTGTLYPARQAIGNGLGDTLTGEDEGIFSNDPPLSGTG